MPTTNDQFLQVDYVDSQDDHGNDDVVVLVHGTGGSVETHFEHVHPMLATRQRVVGVDWADPGTESIETQQLVEQVVGVIEKLELTQYRITLVGYSLGAVIAAIVAAQHPWMVTNLVLVSGWAQTDHQQRLRNQVSQRLAETDPIGLAEFGVFSAFSGTYLASLEQEHIDHMVATMQPEDAFGAKQMELNRWINIAGILGRITAHTLVIGCEQDVMVPVRHQLQLVESIADAQFVSIDAGHAVVFEKPAEIVGHIQDVIDTLA